jgi:hypothetical protein
MFENWENFYLLVGGAAGALIGLFFIVVTLMRGGDADTLARGASVFMTPTVAHLSMVLMLSAVAMAPSVPMALAGWIIGLCAVACLGFAGRSLVMLATRNVKAPHWTDLWFYGVAPFAICLGLTAACVAIWYSPVWAARGIAASLLLLLLIAIRNAWDLVTWITAQGENLGKL